MAFGRHRDARVTQEVPSIVTQKEPIKEAEITPFEEAIQEVAEENQEKVTEPVPAAPEATPPAPVADQPMKKVRVYTEKQKAIKAAQRKANRNKVGAPKYKNIGLVGKTVECNEFRAIVKKKGLTIDKVLTKLLLEWNTANYNL